MNDYGSCLSFLLKVHKQKLSVRLHKENSESSTNVEYKYSFEGLRKTVIMYFFTKTSGSVRRFYLWPIIQSVYDIGLSVRRSVCWSICPLRDRSWTGSFVYSFIHQSPSPPPSPPCQFASDRPSVRLSVRPPVRQSVRPSVRPFIRSSVRSCVRSLVTWTVQNLDDSTS